MEWLAFVMAITCSDGSCDAEDWAPLPPAAEALTADECSAYDPACWDLDDACGDPANTFTGGSCGPWGHR